MRDIGLIGAGYIGKRFVESLREADYSLTVYDVDDSQVEYAEERGAEAADSPAEVGRASDAVFMALPGTPEVEATIEGEDGLLPALDPGDLVVDSTTTKVETAREYEAKCGDRDVHWVSAPLTRAAPVEGIHMMIGGSDASYGEAEELIETVSTRHIRLGDVERALRFKYALQIRYASHLALDAEIVAFARESDVDPRPLNEFLGMDISERLFEGDYTQDVEGLGGLAIWDKDLGYALDVAREDDIAMPLTSLVHETYKHGHRVAREEEGDATTIARYWAALNGR
ncbi:NAD(P)-dependent oxidoreductase [Salinirubellus sp. GCM10025818]|uniref:NAD(P)-dependent oxidoreductase n=1 Tax=Salinirubellus TaxID=2162630 RepID=UPI0030D59C54